MAEPPLHPDADGDEGPGRGPGAGAPLWVKLFGVAALVLLLLFVVLHLTFGGLMRHTP